METKAIKPPSKRSASGRVERHEKAMEKYRNYQISKEGVEKLSEMIKGEKQITHIPKPGEFVVISSGKKEDRNPVLSVPLKELLDGTKTFSDIKNIQHQRLMSPNEYIQTPSVFSRPMTGKYQRSIGEDEKVIEDLEFSEIYDENKEVETKKTDTSKLTLTRNLNFIVKKQQKQFMNPSSRVINHVIEEIEPKNKLLTTPNEDLKKLTRIQSSQTRFRSAKSSLKMARPLSSKYIIDSLRFEHSGQFINSTTLQNALTYDKKALRKKTNSYTVISKIKKPPKYITGFQIVDLQKMRLEEQNAPRYVHDQLKSPFLYENPLAEVLIQKALNLPFPKPLEQPYEKREFFFPLEYYTIVDDEELAPEELFKKFKGNQGNKKIKGFSKWFENNGKFEWKSCEIIGFDKTEEKFEIKWDHNQKAKKVTRVNLRFEEETQSDYEDKLARAEKFRELSEIFFRYNYVIDQMKSPTNFMKEETLDRITFLACGFNYKINLNRDILKFLESPASERYNCKRYLMPLFLNIISNNTKKETNVEILANSFKIKGFNLDLLNELVKEIKESFIRANHVIEFNVALPYSELYRPIFEPFLDEEMFIPLIEKPTPETDENGCLDVGYEEYSPKVFLNLVKKASKILHQASTKKLNTLLSLNISLQHFNSLFLFLETYHKPFFMEEFFKLQESKSKEIIRDFKSRMYDTHFEIMDMVEDEIRAMKKRNEERALNIVIESERKLAEEKELPLDIANSLKNFQKLVNMILERAARKIYEMSIYRLINDFFRIGRKIEDRMLHFKMEDGLKDYSMLLKFQNLTKFDKFDITHPQLEIILNYNDEFKLEFQPPLNEWKERILNMVNTSRKVLGTIESLKSKEIGSARETNLMKVFFEEDPLIHETNEKFERILNFLIEIPVLLERKMESFTYLHENSVEAYKKKFKKCHFHDFENEIKKIKSLQKELEECLFSNKIATGLFLIDVETIKKTNQKKLSELFQVLNEVLLSKINHENTKLEDEVNKILTDLKKTPKDIEEMHELRTFAKVKLPEILIEINQKIASIMNKMTLLDEMGQKLSPEDFAKCWASFGHPLRLFKRKEKCLGAMGNKERVFIDDLMKQQGELALEIQNLRNDLEILMKAGDMENYEKISNDFLDIGERINNSTKEGEIINRREEILNYKQSDYVEIEKIRKTYLPYNQVWSLARDSHFKLYTHLNSNLNTLERDTVTSEVLESWKDLFKKEKTTFKLVPHMLKVTTAVRKEFEKFKPYLPLINDLRNPALKQRHWTQLAVIMKIEGEETATSLKLQDLLDKGIMDIKDQIRDISEIASKEYSFEKILTKMKKEWKDIKFELTPFRDTGCHILKSIETIMDKLDEDITKMNTISASPYIKFLLGDVNAWRNTLVKAQDIIEIWCKVQKSWQYLQPIFFSEDIITNMDQEGKKYSIVDKIWRTVMQQTLQYPTVLDSCSQNKIKETFETCLEQLDSVMKGLNKFLNEKRLAFPRFFFLSNEELLSILAQAREPKAVQRYLSKCFEGIEALTFEEDLKITQFHSNEMETIDFIQQISPFNQENQLKGVEEWLGEVEKSMKLTLKSIYVNALQSFKPTDRKKWLFQWPAQISVICEQTMWTNSVIQAILNSKKNPETYQILFNRLEAELQEIVELVRVETNKRNTITLGVLVVMEVHAKDVLYKLWKEEIKDLQDFEWLSQMRYYHENSDLSVKMVNTERKYGFEYLGNQTRLVITPLTDRCYRTLMSALQMNLGGSPEGPAGTGKTETVKDLAKALAKHCMVFNCSDRIDIFGMAKFFKGLCACGSWACFDEFNRIELEVLSVIAQQILTIQTAILKEATYSKARQFTFEGTTLTLDSSCAIFTTMNPGYAGRSELPDNLKALFRPVAMMIPNYAMISEISLYSYGYMDARNLAIKITQSLKLASEQLSTQSHYDFGMRAIKSIIMAAGNLKRLNEEGLNEEILVLRAISDCNLPKFTSQDIPLFNAIISDLFPHAEKQEREYGILSESIKEIEKVKNLKINEKIYTKIIELYETIRVRHGVMIVGDTLSGKSTILDTLASSLELKSKRELQLMPILTFPEPIKTIDPIPPEAIHNNLINPQVVPIDVESDSPSRIISNYQKVIRFNLNPKAITDKLLYGENDQTSNEWHDGICARIFRDCFEEKPMNLKWIVFDGPVDALWIENLNTVLDDNKKLCLANGETIKMTENMNVMFEVENLAVASPATVSRCGMVYLEPEIVELEAFFNSWVLGLPVNFIHEDSMVLFKELYLNGFLSMLELSMKEFTFAFEGKMGEQWLVLNCLKLFEGFLLKDQTKEEIMQNLQIEHEKEMSRLAALKLEGKEDITSEMKKALKLSPKEKTEFFGLFYLAVVWSLGVVLDEKSSVLFDKYLKMNMKKMMNSNKEIGAEGLPPDDINIYELNFLVEKRQWVLWKPVNEIKLSQDLRFHEIYIPTRDSIRVQSLIKRLLTHNFAVLIMGKTGTGKTLSIKRILLNDMDMNRYLPTLTTFSANTKTNQVQDVLEGKIEKTKRKKGVFGPLYGTKNIIFIDDLNMPNKDEFGSQPPLELIRQWFTLGGWYDRKSLEYKNIVDIQFAAAMGLGRARVSNRILRHFNIIYQNELDQETMFQIAKAILDWGLYNYVDKLKFMVPSLTKLSLKMYKLVSKEFLPLPRKSHYLFNLRDMMKVLQGLLAVPANKYEAMSDNKRKMLKLWLHENLCVYYDRLVDEKDQTLFIKLMNSCMIEEMKLQIKEFFDNNENWKISQLIFGNFLEPHAVIKSYCEIEDKAKFKSLIHEYIEEFNTLAKNKLDIVLFEDALNLLARINRILNQPFGNALLVGLGGSGRHSLTRLATYMQDYQLYEIEMDRDFSQNEWYEYLKEMLKSVGLHDKQAVFLVSDANIVNESFLEDINNLLNNGEIPKLYNTDEKENLYSDLKDAAEKQNKKNLTLLGLFEFFVNTCKLNLHIVLCLNPIGDKLRLRLRNFPSFVNCTSIIWLNQWSDDALYSVATHFLEDQDEGFKIEDPENLSKIAKICLNFHSTVDIMSKVYFQEQGKYNYVTPISYIQLLQRFRGLYTKSLKDKENRKMTYLNGVEKLDQCSVMVVTMSQELENLKPILIRKTKETDEIMKNVERETGEAEKQRLKIQDDEIETARKADIAATIQAECKEKLSEAEPELEAAMEALKTLKIQDFVEIKSLLKPPIPIRITMDAVCIMMDRKPKKTQEKDEDYWEEAKKLLNEPGKFIKSLELYKRDNIPEKVIQKMTKFLEANPKFQPHIVKNASVAAEGLCKWVRAIYKYYHVFKAITPLREDLDRANMALQQATDELNSKRRLLMDVEEKCKDLRDKFEAENFAKQKLKLQISECEMKMIRAKKLTSGLGGERELWLNEAKKNEVDISNLLGDMLLSVGFISYLGAFTGSYRQKIITDNWILKILEEGIKCTQPFNFINQLGNPLEIQMWLFNGLPLDNVSVENQLIMKNSDRWPLIIDPQNQARKFLKRFETLQDEKKLVVAKAGKFMEKQLEQSIRMGFVLIIESIGETLDPILDNVLLKNVQKRAGLDSIILGNNVIEYNSDFRLYLITTLPNPHYMPETMTKITLINFSITSEGLKDQLLSILVKEEEPKDEDEKIRMIQENAESRELKKKLEDEILSSLSKADSAKLLDDEILIKNLTESKSKSEEMENKISASKSTEDRINATRNIYEPVANCASNLYFTVLQLNKLDPMYQFSLDFYLRIFRNAIKIAEKPPQKNPLKRVGFLLESFKKLIYYEINRSIFVKHKLLFALMITLAQLKTNNLLNLEEFQFFTTGVSSNPINDKDFPNPSTDDFSEKIWENILHLSNIQKFNGIVKNIIKNKGLWLGFMKDIETGAAKKAPNPYNNLQNFSYLLLTKCLKPEFLIRNIKEFIQIELGDSFIENPIISLDSSYKESSNQIPLIFLLSPGDDPQDELKKFAQDKSRILIPLSLGKGQGENAENNIKDAVKNGYWILLQNCHLALSWLPRLEVLAEEIALDAERKKVHSEFRLWLTSFSNENFSRYLLQESVKITKDPPKGIKSNLMQLYSNMNSTKNERNFFAACTKQEEWQKLFMGLCFFHALIRERRRFGPIGWNIYYDFNDSDFKISMRQLQHVLNTYDMIPFKALIYLTGECYYGGKVTDDWDRRVLNEILKSFYNEIIIYEDYKFSGVNEYHIPDGMNLETAIGFIEQLPERNDPELFGLHENAAISSALLEGDFVVNSLLNINPKTSDGTSTDKNKTLSTLSKDILHSLPQLFIIEEILRKYPTSYYESMNTVLVQELMRYNTLIKTIQLSLLDLNAALDGQKVMTAELEKLGESLLNNCLPSIWADKSYPCLKPLMSYIFKDLQKRIDMFKEWINNGIPIVFWVSGFFFTQCFFTGVLQNYARKTTIPIDKLTFDYLVIDQKQEFQAPPSKGCYIEGLFMEGARWNEQSHKIDEALFKQLYQKMPIIWLIPKEKVEKDNENNEATFLCPVYKTLERKGVLSTTGHSTNFILAMRLPCEENESHWVKRGAAMITQLND